MLVNIAFDEHASDLDVINVPSSIANNIDTLHHDFCKWIHDRNVGHCYWVYRDNVKIGCCYDTEAFILWLNENILSNEQDKAMILQKNATELIFNSPILYF